MQIGSKTRAELIVGIDETEEGITSLAKALPGVEKWLSGKEIKRVIYVPHKLINFVVA